MTVLTLADEISISVVIPTYNRRESLKVTLAGLSNQSYSDGAYEVIVVSDGSSDGTDVLMDEYRAKSPFAVKFLEQKNMGPSCARNRGVSEAKNDVVVFIDDDVEPVENFLRVHAAWHKKDEKIAVIGPLLPDRYASEPAWITWEHQKLQRIYDMFLPNGKHVDDEAGANHFYSGNASVRRKWLIEANGFDLRYTRQEDVELAVRLQNQFGIRFVIDFDAVGRHRPSRTFASWLHIPADYGRLDAQRVLDGTMSRQAVEDNLKNRHPLSTAVGKFVQSSNFNSSVAICALKALALTASTIGLRNLALVLLSGLYNSVYLSEYRRECVRLNLLAASAVDRAPSESKRTI